MNGMTLPSRKPSITNFGDDEQEGSNMAPAGGFKPVLTDVQPDWLKAEVESDAPDGDQYLGDLEVDTDAIYIVCWDHMQPDGDRVRMTVNEILMADNLTLQTKPRKVRIDLNVGFNAVEILALNQGQSGPNTAAFEIFDDNNKLLKSNKWNLRTGSKANMVVVRNPQ